MNQETTKVLQALSGLDSCRFDAYLTTVARDDVLKKKAKTEKNTFLLVDIVIYGPKPIRNSIDCLMSSARIYLQHPCYREPNTEYDNPHFLNVTDLVTGSDALTSTNSRARTPLTVSEDVRMLARESEEEVRTQAQFQKRVATVFGSLTRFKTLKRLEADVKITTSLYP
jgi:hypothetical protein